MDCLFCKIINKEIPSYKIYEDEIAYAFMDINPDSNGHTLIIPKKHFSIAKKIKKELEEKLNIDGLTFIQNNGDVQDVKHFHLHLKPFYNQSNLKSVEEVYKILKS